MKNLEKLTDAMMEHICDHLCRFPQASQDQLDEICAECQMGQFVCGILNSHNEDLKEEA